MYKIHYVPCWLEDRFRHRDGVPICCDGTDILFLIEDLGDQGILALLDAHVVDSLDQVVTSGTILVGLEALLEKITFQSKIK